MATEAHSQCNHTVTEDSENNQIILKRECFYQKPNGYRRISDKRLEKDDA